MGLRHHRTQIVCYIPQIVGIFLKVQFEFWKPDSKLVYCSNCIRDNKSDTTSVLKLLIYRTLLSTLNYKYPNVETRKCTQAGFDITTDAVYALSCTAVSLSFMNDHLQAASMSDFELNRLSSTDEFFPRKFYTGLHSISFVSTHENSACQSSLYSKVV